MPGRTDIIEIEAEKLIRMQTLHVAFLLFDVRGSQDYMTAHIQGAVNVPSEEFMKKLPQMVPKKDTPIVVYDSDGVRSGDLTLEAEKVGFLNVVNLEGGFQAYSLAPGNLCS